MKTEKIREYIERTLKGAAGAQRKTLTALALLFISLLLLYIAAPISQIKNRPASLVVTDRRGRVLRGTLSRDGEWRLPIPLEDMGHWMPKVIVALEDGRFWTHCGADAVALARAAVQNTRSGKIISGGSTITSQVIRLSEPRDRTVVNKLKEFRDAMTLELFMTKHDILETYLNSAPFGGNIRGVEAASLTWFGKQAGDISLAEAALLAGILRGPAVYRPDRHPSRAKALRDRLLDALAEEGVATKEEAERAKSEPIPAGKRPLPAVFAQAAAKAAQTVGPTGSETDKFGRFRSTLDLDMQNLLQAELSRSANYAGVNITAAAVLVENKSGAVRGYIGNVREGTDVDASWVDCADSYRSPGSTMKPFVYTLTFEAGKLIPSTMLADVSDVDSPRNFDRLFRGPVSARTALAESLNVPAVRVLRIAGGRKTLDLYRRLGFKGFKEKAEWYGDSLILGGCEATALELAKAYRALANGGFESELVWREGAKSGRTKKVLSGEACALTLDILKDTRRLLPLYAEIFGEKGAAIAFKTGTSYGRRDAWTAAVTPEYTLIIWYGDPSGRPNEHLVGARIAAPSAIRIMKKIMPEGAKWFKLPRKVSKGTFCALSGAPRNHCCPQRMDDLYIPDVSPLEPCTLHVVEEGRVKVKWPKELAEFFVSETREKAVRQLKIVSPRSGAHYTNEGSEEIFLEARGGTGELYWFVDGEFFGATGPDRDYTVKWKAGPGRHRISVADEAGSKADAIVTVSREKERKEDELPLLKEWEEEH